MLDKIYKILFFITAILCCENRNPINTDNATYYKNKNMNSYNSRLNRELKAKILFVAYEGGRNRLYRMNIDGGNKNLLVGNRYVEFAQWSPNGKKIVYCEAYGITIYYLYLINEDGSNERLLLENGSHPSWSPKGDRIFYYHRFGWEGTIMIPAIVDTSGNNYIINLPNEVAYASDTVNFNFNPALNLPQWSPDGEYLFVYGRIKTKSNNGEIFAMLPETGEIVNRITNNNIDETGFRLSPNGEQIAMKVGSYFSSFIHYMNLSDTADIRITQSNSKFPKWSNDSKQIIYLKKIDKYYHIYLINPQTPFEEIKLFDFLVSGVTPDIYFEDVNTGIWDDP